MLVTSALALIGVFCVVSASATVVGGRLGTGRASAPALRVYAWGRTTGRLYSLAAGTATTWSLDLPPGRYWLFAGLEGPGAPPVYAAYTEYSRCQHRPAQPPPACDGHQIAELEVGTHALRDIDLTDWALSDDSASAIDNLLGRPPVDPYDESGRAAPKFSEYPARSATPAASAREATGFHDADRDAVAAALAGSPNFAGRLQLVPVACGSNCSGVAVLDHATGAVHYPAALNPLPEPPACEAHALLQYRRDSRLLIIKSAQPKDPAGATMLHYYTVDGDGAELRLVTTQTNLDPTGAPRCAPSERAGR